ncbi:hypothetical protein [Streptomyces griseoviridis]|uniref:AAA+ ATPase domain-containing protein n=1 Tax=Streptomyces griseoviridis TaxID=45398 RepID=A0ABT9LKU3_STRGD|nr:hypothetical protein [Streptomyces griseoviridis]MDP9683106.1 hypothetical protein [Streptomyces griseoviridis]
MARSGGDLKAWLCGLDDDGLRELLRLPGPLPYLANVRLPGRTIRYGKRELRTARAWLGRAKAHDVKLIAESAAKFSGDVLATREDLPAERFEGADPEVFETLFTSLPPVLATLTLHALALEEGTLRQAMVEEHWTRFTEAAAKSVDHQDAQAEQGMSLREESEESGGADPLAEVGGAVDERGQEMASLPNQVTATVLEKALGRLRLQAEELTSLLRATAENVADGRAVPESVLARVAEWNNERAFAARAAQNVGREWTEDSGWSQFQGVVDDLRAEEQRANESASRIATLQEQRKGLLAALRMIEKTGGGPHVDPIRQALRALDEQITELGGEAVGTEPETDADEVRVPSLRAGDEVVGQTPSREGAQPDSARGEAASVTTRGPLGLAEVPEPAAPDTSITATPAAEPALPPEDAPEEACPRGVSPAVTEPSSRRTMPESPTAGTERTGGTESGITAAVTDSPHMPAAPAPEEADTKRPLVWQGNPLSPEVSSVSPVQRLVQAGRFQEAYWMTVGSGEPRYRADCLAFADAAFATVLPEDGTAVISRFGPDLERLQSDRPALMVAAVASVRAGLIAGHPNDVLLQCDPSASLQGPWRRLLECALDILKRYQPLDPASLRFADVTNPPLTRAGIAQEAARLREEVPKHRIGYARATQVKNLLMRHDQPLGFALRAIENWASGTAERSLLDDAWRVFSKRDAAERVIEDADAAIRTPKQAKVPIEAKARRSLLSRIDQVVTLLVQARALAASEAKERSDTLTDLGHALAQVGEEEPPPGVEGAALLRLRCWFEGQDAPSATDPRKALLEGSDESEYGKEYGPDGYGHGPIPAFSRALHPAADALLASPDLPRTLDGKPDPTAPGFVEAVGALLGPVDVPSILLTYAERGDLHLADALVETLGQGLVPSVGTGQGMLPTDWRARRDTQWARWSAIRAERHRVASGLLAELRTQQNLDVVTERGLVGRLEQLEQTVPEGAFRTTVERIRRLEADLEDRVQAHVRRLRGQLESMNLSEKDRDRIHGLLESGDTVTAEECLALLRKGDSLPEWTGEAPGEDLERFVAGLDTITPVKSGQQGVSARPWANAYADGEPLTDTALAGLESWDALGRPTTRGAEWQKHVPTVLRLLGLEGRPPSRDDQRQVRGILRLTAKLRAGESAPGYVADLGSAASTYTVLVVTDELRGRSPLELLDRNDTGACIILYLYPLGMTGRRKLVMHARTSSQQALVVDPAVFGWVVARSPRSFRALQRVTLPWTGFKPYTPFVAGLVPPEVFYGRSEEMAEVVNPLGALFLYGGRQLGKSALLRKVEADYPSSPERKAVYLDLKARGVGEAEPAERIWPVLAAELKRVGILASKVSTAMPPDQLVEQVRRWLEENPDRRVLVLADEADAFLTADSKAVRGAGGEGTFANVARLKGLMDSTDRRFKVIFAGLHQVQRFSKLSNVPLAHGRELLIGPLKPAEAQRLVVGPMAAFGYRFERAELVWRVLAATNYQACLVQIFCERLVTALREKPVGSAQWPITVTEEDVRAVTRSAEVHRSIAERMRLTINLEDRYRVLALVIALRSHADGFQRGYDADELLHAARERWEDGFRGLTANDVKIYLDEMVGLGLLVQQVGDHQRYAVRSPNVVHMLGTREDLELELEQTKFSLPYDYNPRFSRRLVGQDREGVHRYSPLTEQELFLATSPGLRLVCLTKAHGPKLTMDAVRSYAEARELAVYNAAPDTLVDVLTKATRDRLPGVVVADLRYLGMDSLTEALERFHQYTAISRGDKNRAVIALVDPRARAVLDDERVTEVIRPARWNVDSLRAWPESPFDTPDKRSRLVDATGGWPHLVERTVDLATRGGATLETALETSKAVYDLEEAARGHLERVELDVRTLTLLGTWVQYLEPGDASTLADIAAVTSLTAEETSEFIRRLEDHGVLDEREEGYALDLVSFRALQTVERQA